MGHLHHLVARNVACTSSVLFLIMCRWTFRGFILLVYICAYSISCSYLLLSITHIIATVYFFRHFSLLNKESGMMNLKK